MCWWGIFVIVWPLGHPFQPCEESQHRGNRLLSNLAMAHASVAEIAQEGFSTQEFPGLWLCLNPLVRACLWVVYSGEATRWRPLGWNFHCLSRI